MSRSQPQVCPSCGSSEYMRDGKCYSAECPAYLATAPAVPLEQRMKVPDPMPGYEDHDDESVDEEDLTAPQEGDDDE